MSDIRFSSASVAMVNSTWLLTNDQSTLMMPSIVAPALQQAELPYTACDLPSKSHHSALFSVSLFQLNSISASTIKALAHDLTIHRSPLPGHATIGQAGTKTFTGWSVYFCTATNCYYLSYPTHTHSH